MRQGVPPSVSALLIFSFPADPDLQGPEEAFEISPNIDSLWAMDSVTVGSPLNEVETGVSVSLRAGSLLRGRVFDLS